MKRILVVILPFLQIRINPVVPDGDSFFANILLQVAKHRFECSEEGRLVQNNIRNIELADSMEGNILQLS